MNRVFLMGQSERGRLCAPHSITGLPQLLDTLGHPPADSLGIHYAVQTLLFERELIYFCVGEEGFNKSDYQKGAQFLTNEGKELKLCAICLPGVGDPEIIETFSPLSFQLKSPLILTQKDLYDYLTAR